MGDFAHVIYVIKTVMKYHLKKIDTSFHQPLPNMVQRLFADVMGPSPWNSKFKGPSSIGSEPLASKI
jgi:hypothetical protein